MESDRAFADILNDCLEAIAAGEADLEECLARYPQHAGRLAELLRLGDAAKTYPLPTPTPEMLAAGERRLVQAARSKVAQVRAGPKRASLLDALKARLHAGPRWVLPVAALSASVAVLFVCVILAVIGGGRAWKGLRGTDAMPGSPPAAISEDDRGASLLPSPTVKEGLAQSISPLPSPTVEEGLAQFISPLPSPTVIPEGDDSGSVYTVHLPLASRPLPPHLAMLEEVQGLVEVQGVDGGWSVAGDRQTIEAGTRVRTGALSRANIAFYDGSTAYLEPDTEISLDALGRNHEDQSRIVELTQWVGETDHDVAPSYGTHARYEVHTPSGTGAAKGTFFHVSVTTALVVHFRVDEGAVAVTHLDVTVVVVAGQLTTIEANKPPGEPVFRVTGEGQVEATGATWRIAGQDFQTHAATVIVGNPQVGDWVHVDGRLLADGTRLADRIVLLRRLPANHFTIVGQVEAMGALTWTVAGQEIAVDEATAIDEGIQIGDRVRVEGVIEGPAGGTLLAETIALIDAQGVPFSFVGVVAEIAEAYWVVSGVPVTVDARTAIADDLVVGDIVRVRGVFLDQQDDVWLARSIRRLVPEELKFEFVGLVDSTNPWVVSGIAIETRTWTEIKDPIEVGDRVKVEGRILPDGTWLAEEIKLADDDEHLSFEFVGRVEGIAPWVVSGIPLTVNYRTEIKDEIAVGDRVKVEGQILPTGEWLATEIVRVDPRLGRECMQFTSLVVRVGADQIFLQNGATIPLGADVQIEGHIQVNSVISFYLCVGEDGKVIVANIIVIAYIEPVIVVQPTTPPTQPPSPAQPPPPPGGASPIVVSENNQTETFTCNGNSVTINGNSNTITLLGSCGPVTVRGNNNWVSIQSAASVTNTGNNNTIVGP